jgi:hypothetical protein
MLLLHQIFGGEAVDVDGASMSALLAVTTADDGEDVEKARNNDSGSYGRYYVISAKHPG